MTDVSLNTATLDELAATTDGEFVGELIAAFAAEAPQLIAQLRHALAMGDAVAFRRAAHSLKSNGASLGALELSAQAQALEQLGKASNIAGAGSDVERLAAEYERARLALEAWQYDG